MEATRVGSSGERDVLSGHGMSANGMHVHVRNERHAKRSLETERGHVVAKLARERAVAAMATRFFSRQISFQPSVAKASKRRVRRTVDMGWDKLIAPLDAAPLALPKLRSLKVYHGRNGTGQTGARKFRALMPPLRWQNPEAEIAVRWLEEPGPPRLLLELEDGQSQELQVLGQRSEEILGEVLRAAGAPAESIEPSMQWAAEFLRPPPRVDPDAAASQPPEADTDEVGEDMGEEDGEEKQEEAAPQ